jgi:F420-dependent oxidoreductase-like protein
VTVPELGVNLASAGLTAEQVGQLAKRAEHLGYSSLWASESWGSDAFTPLACAAASTSRIKLGTGIAQIPARTPAATAMAALSLQQLSRGRLLLGLGVSGPLVVEGWHGVPFGKPLVATREYIAVLRQALAAEQPVEFHGQVYDIPFRGPGATNLGRPLRAAICGAAETPILVAAVGPKNVRQAVKLADGVLPFLWSPSHWKIPWGDALSAAPDGFHVACSVWVAIGNDLDGCRDAVRPLLARYIGAMGAKDKNFYASLVASYGYDEAVGRVQDLYLSGHRKEAVAAVPDDLVDELTLVGEPARVRDRLHAWASGPVTTLIANPIDDDSMVLFAELNS